MTEIGLTGFHLHLTEGLKWARQTEMVEPEFPIHQVVLAGSGTSGIAASLMEKIAQEESSIPFLKIPSGNLPAFVNKHSLFIGLSESGNSSEIVALVKQALSQRAKLVILSGTGALEELVISNSGTHMCLPAKHVEPKASLAYQLCGMIVLACQMNLLSPQKINQLRTASDLINFDSDEIRRKAEKIALLLKGKKPVIYCDESLEPVARSFRQRLNFHNQILTWHHSFPEILHHELAAWTRPTEELAVVIFRIKDSPWKTENSPGNAVEHLAKYSSTVLEVYSKGQSLAERSLYLIHLSDWISYYLGGPQPIKIQPSANHVHLPDEGTGDEGKAV